MRNQRRWQQRLTVRLEVLLRGMLLLQDVLSIAVTTKIYLSLECPRTEVAGKRLITGVLTSVGNQIGRLRECLAANIALVWLLAGVNISVLLHVRFLVKTFSYIWEYKQIK